MTTSHKDPSQLNQVLSMQSFRSLVQGDKTPLAVQIFNDLDTLMPLDHPRIGPPVDWEAFKPNDPRDTDAAKERFKAACIARHERVIAASDAQAENQRRLRTTMWEEAMLRASGKHADYAAMLTSHHRREWRIARVSDDSAEREKQISDAIKLRGERT